MSFQREAFLGFEGMFLGFLVSSPFEEKLALAPQPLQDLLLHSRGEEYLSAHSFQGVRYIGKKINEMVSFSSLEFLECHIYSLLKKLVPDFPYIPGEMHLFSLLLYPSEE